MRGLKNSASSGRGSPLGEKDGLSGRRARKRCRVKGAGRRVLSWRREEGDVVSRGEARVRGSDVLRWYKNDGCTTRCTFDAQLLRLVGFGYVGKRVS